MLMNSENKNLIEAYEILRQIPADRFVESLTHYFQNRMSARPSPTPTTLACAAGWLSLTEQFKTSLADGYFQGFFTPPADFPSWKEWSDHHFGDNSFPYLFSPSFASFYDAEFKLCPNDRARVLYRIRRYMGESCEHARKHVLEDISHEQQASQ
jgi:hypothetical protein